MKIKDGVSMSGVRPEIAIALQIVEPILNTYGQETVVTSCMEGRHKRASAHYSGRAVDLRIWDITNKDKCMEYMQDALGRDYDVIMESNHIHLEFDPKIGANL